jgi:hypothetical protein
MPQRVPEFRFSDDALVLRQFLYEHWCAHGRGPTLGDVHTKTGFTRERTVTAYRELDLGGIVVLHQSTQNMSVLKIQPFSAFASQVAVWRDGAFFTYAGCAMESVAFSRMPPFKGQTFRMESYCPCCYAPVRVDFRDGEVLAASPASVLIHVSVPTWDWNKVDITEMCDGMNYVVDATHAATYERKIGRRGILLTVEQAKRFVKGTGDNRMVDYHWPPVSVNPEKIVLGLKALGVDVSPWGY